jgi:hypothetical protein
VLGGQCIIAATLDEHGTIVHLNNDHELSYGERDGARSAHPRDLARNGHLRQLSAHLADASRYRRLAQVPGGLFFASAHRAIIAFNTSRRNIEIFGTANEAILSTVDAKDRTIAAATDRNDMYGGETRELQYAAPHY